MEQHPLIAVTMAGEDWNYGRTERLYVAAVEAAGGRVRPVRPDAVSDLPGLLRSVAGVLLSGGDDLSPEYYDEEPRPELKLVNPERDRMEYLLARAVLAQGVPTLGICNGLQVLNVAAGGDLHQDIPTQAPGPVEHAGDARHSVTLEAGSHLHALVGADAGTVNSFHHQGVRRVGRGLRVAARSADGLVEALERPGPGFLLGVQWHPERDGCDPGLGASLVSAFVAAAAENSLSKGESSS